MHTTREVALDAAYRQVKATGTVEDVKKYREIIRAAIMAASACDNSAAWIIAVHELETEFIDKLFNIQDAVMVEETTDGVEPPAA